MSQKINIVANVTAVTITPITRVLRTLFQIVVSVGIAIPVILNTPGVAGNAIIVKDLTILGGLVAVVTAIMNGLESSGVIPVVGGQPASLIVPEVSAADSAHAPPKAVPSL